MLTTPLSTAVNFPAVRLCAHASLTTVVTSRQNTLHACRPTFGRGVKESMHARICCRAVTEQAQQSVVSTQWFQKIVQLPAQRRGCHVITRKLLQELPELNEYEIGMANLFVMHTSASLTINENASSDVPLDLNDSLDRLAPEGNQYRHSDEGPDDMPAHVKSSLMGASLNIPVRHGQFAMGTWQGLYLNEHRDHGGSRKVCVTIQGQKRSDGRKYR